MGESGGGAAAQTSSTLKSVYSVCRNTCHFQILKLPKNTLKRNETVELSSQKISELLEISGGSQEIANSRYYQDIDLHLLFFRYYKLIVPHITDNSGDQGVPE